MACDYLTANIPQGSKGEHSLFPSWFNSICCQVIHFGNLHVSLSDGMRHFPLLRYNLQYTEYRINCIPIFTYIPINSEWNPTSNILALGLWDLWDELNISGQLHCWVKGIIPIKKGNLLAEKKKGVCLVLHLFNRQMQRAATNSTCFRLISQIWVASTWMARIPHLPSTFSAHRFTVVNRTE